jgi:hypothetical protein
MIRVSWLPGTLFPVVTGLQKGGLQTVYHEMSTNVELSQVNVC